MEWQAIDTAPEAVVVETKIDDAKGERRFQPLKRIGNLWFVPDGSMYVYYTPTHWRKLSDPYLKYRRTQVCEMADWEPGFDMTGVSVSDADKANGSPKAGDKIARNPANHADRWLVAKAYFEANFENI